MYHYDFAIYISYRFSNVYFVLDYKTNTIWLYNNGIYIS